MFHKSDNHESGCLISIYNRQKDLKISSRSLKKTVARSLKFHDVSCHEIAIHFVTDHMMRKLHQDYFNDPSPTDCISFPYDKDHSSGYFFLGEIFICPKTAIQYIKKKGKGDVYQEVTLYLIHGILHLLGYDDIDSKDRKIMRLKEKELLGFLKDNNQLLFS